MTSSKIVLQLLLASFPDMPMQDIPCIILGQVKESTLVMLWFVTKVCLKICQWEYVFYVLALNPIFWALLLRRASVNYMYDGLLATNLSYQCWLPLEIVEGLYRDRDLKFRRPN